MTSPVEDAKPFIYPVAIDLCSEWLETRTRVQTSNLRLRANQSGKLSNLL